MRFVSIAVLIVAAAACQSGSTIEVNSPTTGAALDCDTGDICIPHTFDLVAGQNIDAGDVVVTNDGEYLYVEIIGSGWSVTEVHIYAGTAAGIPRNNKGTPVPGRFPFNTEYPAPVPSHTERIALADLNLEAECGSELTLIVHAVVQETDCGAHVREETAFAKSDESFEVPRWGWYANYHLCCGAPPPPPGEGEGEYPPGEGEGEYPPGEGEGEEPPAETCSETVDYWQYIPYAEWPYQNPYPLCWDNVLNRPIYDAQAIGLPAGTLFNDLAREFVAAQNNATCEPYDCLLGPAASDATYILSDCVVSSTEAARAADIVALFQSYNAGTYVSQCGCVPCGY